MRKALVLSILVLTLSMAGAVAGSRVQKAEAYPEADGLRIVNTWCNPDGTAGFTFAFNSYNFGAYMFIDISHSNNGFFPGTYVVNGPYPASTNSFSTWYGIRASAPVYLRVNVFDGFFWWYPSQTIQFFTPACGIQVIDSDNDGVPNNIDACPFQPGPSWNNGCPAPVPPPQSNCDPVTGWCPGQAPPASRCPGQQAQILIFPPPQMGCVWHFKAEGANYGNGEQLHVCYWVNQQMTVEIRNQTPAGTNTIAGPQVDVPPHGMCFFAGNVSVPPAGLRTLTLYGNNTALDTSTYNGQ